MSRSGVTKPPEVVSAGTERWQAVGVDPVRTSGGLLEQATDRTLVERCVDGDTRAFQVLITRYGRMMKAYAVRLTRSSADGDDVVQEALISAWKRIDTLEAETAQWRQLLQESQHANRLWMQLAQSATRTSGSTAGPVPGPVAGP